MDAQELLTLVAENQKNITQLMSQLADGPAVGRKHDIGATYTGDIYTPNYLHEDAFFQQCELQSSILNFTLQPMHSMINFIPSRASRVTDKAYGALTDFSTTLTGNRPNDVCEPGQNVDGTFEFCKVHYPWSRLALNAGTFELDALIRKACDFIYDHFYFVGDIRGISSPPNRRLDPLNDRGLINEAAIMRVMAIMARIFQEHLARMFWVGDPINNTTPTGNGEAGYREFLGLEHFVDDDIPNSVALANYLESSSGVLADCAAMNSDIKVFDECIGGFSAAGYNLWTLMEELEDTLYRRARAMSLLPVDWRWVMSPIHWHELMKVLPCEKASNGCINMGDPIVGGGGEKRANLDLTMMLTERERMESAMTLTMNGRTRPVILDDTLSCTRGQAPDENELTCDIWLIPWSAAGEELLWLEYMPYNEIDQYLRPIPTSQDTLRGWTDQGKYHHVIQQILRCFNIDVKTENRLIFRGSPLAGKITGVRACTIQEKPSHVFAEKTWGALT